MSRTKWAVISIGSVIAIAHIGVLGHLIKRPPEPKVAEVPTINIPHGPYTSYKITAGREGYTIEYKANDPAILESQRSLDLDKERRVSLVVVENKELSIVEINTPWKAPAIWEEVPLLTVRERVQKTSNV